MKLAKRGVVENEAFAKFIKAKICKKEDEEAILKAVRECDLDRDGGIGEADLITAQVQQVHNMGTMKERQVFPKEKMDHDAAVEIASQIRK